MARLLDLLVIMFVLQTIKLLIQKISSYYKVISRKNIKLDFLKYFSIYVFFCASIISKTIVKKYILLQAERIKMRQQYRKCTKLKINSEILETDLQKICTKTVPYIFSKMPNVTSFRTWLYRIRKKLVISQTVSNKKFSEKRGKMFQYPPSLKLSKILDSFLFLVT